MWISGEIDKNCSLLVLKVITRRCSRLRERMLLVIEFPHPELVSYANIA